MSEITPGVLWAVFWEMLGLWLPVLIAAAVLVTVLFVLVLRRDGLRFRRLVGSQVAGLAGGLAALVFMWAVTNSSPRDVGGPVDVLLLLGIYLLGWGGGTMLFYALAGLAARRRARQPAARPVPRQAA
ncbi:DUF5368 family protein [Rubellimicrobium sp. CFH 75288]|uniref:DUF5368 family protein n=1 Tax=Rubellimicrobium sp. CFH 75288 TaxID=2697034 RepID=UPI0014131A58|nr:DUF5368 family protein [Rubellimicrobium sp. CFH 75288]NAZ35360.1 hypothetical protein [Rubellimicrobium sp. CFH 75288]